MQQKYFNTLSIERDIKWEGDDRPKQANYNPQLQPIGYYFILQQCLHFDIPISEQISAGLIKYNVSPLWSGNNLSWSYTGLQQEICGHTNYNQNMGIQHPPFPK